MPHAEIAGLSVLIVEDEPLLRRRLATHLERNGMEVTCTGTIQAARQFLRELSFDFALLDVNLPDGSGIELLKEKLFSSNTGVIVMTAFGGVTGAVEAMRLGAQDYLMKPFDPAELPLAVARVRQAQQTARCLEHRQEQGSTPSLFFGSALAKLEEQLQKVLAADRRLQSGLPAVLIQGETGTGKSTLARWLHQQGPRAGRELVEVNCSALPETLAESELFGHERGAFTDARSARIGLFEAADGGTLFLDELPSLSLPMQAKVLMAIEDHKIRRLGANKSLTVDARVIAASNREIKDLVAQGKFREDLYHRLDLYRIHIPPLRERGRDILKLAELLMARLCRLHRLKPRRFTVAGEQNLSSYAWPGNVRELAHELERALVFEENDELDFGHLGPPVPTPSVDAADWLKEGFNFENFKLEEAIDRFIRLALKRTRGNVSAAARLLGVPRDYIRYRLNRKRRRQNPPHK